MLSFLRCMIYIYINILISQVCMVFINFPGFSDVSKLRLDYWCCVPVPGCRQSLPGVSAGKQGSGNGQWVYKEQSSLLCFIFPSIVFSCFIGLCWERQTFVSEFFKSIFTFSSSKSCCYNYFLLSLLFPFLVSYHHLISFFFLSVFLVFLPFSAVYSLLHLFSYSFLFLSLYVFFSFC